MGKFLIGVCVGVLLICGAIFAFVTYEESVAAKSFTGSDANQNRKIKTRFSLESEAYKDKSPCTFVDHKMATGLWEGLRYFPDQKKRQKWVVNRKADGTFQIDFEVTSPEGTETFVESGFWSLSGCLYTSVIKSIDDSPVLFQEVYRVHKLSKEEMVYSNFRTGNLFKITRKAP